MTKKDMWALGGLVIVVAAVVTGMAYPELLRRSGQPHECTMEAKLCPDGSAVGRTGPNCEFAACPSAVKAVSNIKNATYEIEGKSITLVNGVAEMALAPGSAAKLTTRYFGNDTTADLDGDGRPDVAFLLTQDGSGSGTFYYVAVALGVEGGYVGTNAVLLGDRVAPQTTEINDGVLTMNYAERKPNEPMTTRPSIGVSKRLSIQGGRLIEQEFGVALRPQGGDVLSDVNFVCADGNSIHAIFYASQKVFVALSDSRTMTLPQTISASGARYANVNESIVFWNKGDTAFVQEGQKITFRDCAIQPSGRSGITLPPSQPFSRTGVVIADTPGLKKNTPYLSYELPGKPALIAELQFDEQSACGDAKNSIPCIALSAWPPFLGQRVSVSGVEQNGVVTVQRLLVQ